MNHGSAMILFSSLTLTGIVATIGQILVKKRVLFFIRHIGLLGGLLTASAIFLSMEIVFIYDPVKPTVHNAISNPIFRQFFAFVFALMGWCVFMFYMKIGRIKERLINKKDNK